ncbi:condensation domain-containing protein [Tsukamurella soli]|uniref:Condensation domain-containing protein n=1 Tax=Tsukamurella soli TaxID=644556 RepID=A0ABP8JZY9_9ACTN
MQFTELSAYPLRPGTLGQWVPTAQRDFDRWNDDPRGTSPVHEAHLRGALDSLARRRIVGGRESWLAVGIEFDEPLSIPGLREALAAFIDRHEVFRTHVILADGPDGAGRPVRRSLPPDGVELDLRMIGTYHSTGPLYDQLQGEFDRATAPLTWPAYLFATVARPESFTLFFAADHSLVDGYSLVLAPHELTSLYRKATKGSPARLIPTGSYVDFSAAERAAADLAGPDHPAAQRWRAHLAENDWQMASFPMTLLPPSPTQLAAETRAALTHDAEGVPRIPQGALNFHLLDDDRTNRFTLVCSEAGATLVSGVLACMSRINTDLGGGPVFRCVIPRHTRDAEQWLAAMGWFVGIAPFRLDTTGARNFRELARRAQTEWKSSKVGTALPFLRIGELLGRTPTPRFVVSFMDTRSAPGAVYNDAGGASVLRSRDYSIEDVYLWINRTPSGLHVAARFPGFETARRTVRLYLGALRSMLTEIGDSSAYQSADDA